MCTTLGGGSSDLASLFQGECVTRKEVKEEGIFPPGFDDTTGEHALDSVGSVGGGFCKGGHVGAPAMKSG